MADITKTMYTSLDYKLASLATKDGMRGLWGDIQDLKVKYSTLQHDVSKLKERELQVLDTLNDPEDQLRRTQFNFETITGVTQVKLGKDLFIWFVWLQYKFVGEPCAPARQKYNYPLFTYFLDDWEVNLIKINKMI